MPHEATTEDYLQRGDAQKAKDVIANIVGHDDLAQEVLTALADKGLRVYGQAEMATEGSPDIAMEGSPESPAPMEESPSESEPSSMGNAGIPYPKEGKGGNEGGLRDARITVVRLALDEDKERKAKKKKESEEEEAEDKSAE